MKKLVELIERMHEALNTKNTLLVSEFVRFHAGPSVDPPARGDLVMATDDYGTVARCLRLVADAASAMTEDAIPAVQARQLAALAQSIFEKGHP